MMLPEGRLSWSGHMGLEAAPQVMARIRAAGMTIVFVNTRAQAELMFQALWKLNDTTLPIALHHGSLEVEQRRKVEAAMAAGRLRAVVATSSLDLGIDWGGVDQVIQVGAPKGVSRLLQRVGRANHRMDEASRAILVPANRFEVLECEAAIARRQRARTRRRSAAARRPGRAGAAPAGPGLRRAVPAGRRLCRGDHRRALCRADPRGFRRRAALRRGRRLRAGAYERWHKAVPRQRGPDARAQRPQRRRARMNIGTIVEAPMLKVRLVGKRALRSGARRNRGIFRQPAASRRHLHVRRPAAAVPAACAKWWSNARRAATATRWCRPTKAAACR